MNYLSLSKIGMYRFKCRTIYDGPAYSCVDVALLGVPAPVHHVHSNTVFGGSEKNPHVDSAYEETGIYWSCWKNVKLLNKTYDQ